MKKLFFISNIFIICLGCGPTILVDEEKIVSSDWKYDQKLSFDWTVQDTSAKYDIILTVNHLDSFLYQNLYTKLVTQLPDASTKEDVLSLDLRKNSGESQGKCNDNTCEVQFLIQKEIRFAKVGQYKLEMFQHTRDPNLKFVNTISLKIQSTKAS